MDLIPHRGIAIIYFESEQDALKFTDIPNSELKVVNKARTDIINRIKESCSIFVQIKKTPEISKPEIVEEKLRQHLSSIHPFVNFSFKNNEGYEKYVCEAEYAIPSHRADTIRGLDLHICDPIKRPLRLLPFIADSLHQRESSGILLLPELPLSTSYEHLLDESIKFGSVISTSLFPFEPELGGMVLYDHYKDALQAADYFREIYNNAFVFPVNAHRCITFFTDMFETRTFRNPRMFYLLLHGVTNPDPYVKDNQYTKIGDSLLIPFNDFESAFNIYKLVQSQNISSCIISKFCFSSLLKHMKNSMFPIELKEKIIWATFPKPDNAKTIREIATTYFPVDSAFPIIDSNENLSRHAYIQVKNGTETFWFTGARTSYMDVSFELLRAGYFVVDENTYTLPALSAADINGIITAG